MKELYQLTLSTDAGDKHIAVYEGDALTFPETIDVFTTSAYEEEYFPSPGSLFHALAKKGISVRELASHPAFDLRTPCHVWLSESIDSPLYPISRVGCIEMVYDTDTGAYTLDMEGLLHSVHAYFQMLDIVSGYDVPIKLITLPLLGGGYQHISPTLTLIPVWNECVSFLKRNDASSRICILERNPEKAQMIAQSLATYYEAHQSTFAAPSSAENKKLVFISYSSKDKNIADHLCHKLEQNGFPVWYAPRDCKGPYARAIAEAIEKCSHFVIILSQNSLASEHVLNEIDLAFQKLPNGVVFKPLKIDGALFTPSFKYYLSRQHWMDAQNPPLEERLDEFVMQLTEETHE